MLVLVETLVRSLCLEKDSVEVRQMTSDEETIIEVVVKESDMGRVIGKGGKNINAIRTLVQAHSSLNEKGKVIINVDSI